MSVEVAAMPDKRHVAASFSRAARSYDAAADLQRDVGHHLLALLPALDVERWLDLGCGTGYFTRALAQRFGTAGVGLDLAEGMLRHARPNGGAQHWVCADAERLPVAAASTDLVFSSLALQWCGDFDAVLRGTRHALRTGGVLAFSSLSAGTLSELQSSWQRVDGFVHVNRFRPFEAYQRSCARTGWQTVTLEQQAHTVYFNDVRTLMQSLKSIGAQNRNEGRPDGLSGRRRLLALADAYEDLRTAHGLPLTYQVVYGILRKEQ